MATPPSIQHLRTAYLLIAQAARLAETEQERLGDGAGSLDRIVENLRSAQREIAALGSALAEAAA